MGVKINKWFDIVSLTSKNGDTIVKLKNGLEFNVGVESGNFQTRLINNLDKLFDLYAAGKKIDKIRKVEDLEETYLCIFH